MRGRLRSSTTHRSQPLGGAWAVASCAPGAVREPAGLDGAGLAWHACDGAMTAAAALRAAGAWCLDGEARRFDAEDWWFRVRFAAEAGDAESETWLCFDGLATIADAWLNGVPLLSVQGMFTAHERRVDALLRGENELVLRFASLDAALAAKRPRPRWRVPMLEAQQLRWFRTSLLGRTPGWSPPVAAVGPWRNVRLERRHGIVVEDARLQAHGDGALDLGVAVRAAGTSDVRVESAKAVVRRGDVAHEFPINVSVGGGMQLQRVHVREAATWWPHTHGEPALYDVTVELALSSGRAEQLDLGRVGFRTIEVQCADGDFTVRVNGVRVFCRGACWTPLDVVSMRASDAQLDQAFDQVVEAGMNMLRVGGMMAYESDAFLDRCDARGVLLWQDLMFANMDYPEEDAAFVALAEEEVRQQVRRLQGRAAVAVICGSGEVEQQAAMWGAVRERWSPPLFHERLRAVVAEVARDAFYWPSSAHGGDFPHQADAGTTSYFGVGGYRRPLEDARRAEVRFATECLAFANVPDDAGIVAMGRAPVHVRDAAWRERSPRDRGASWDFDDVRDHYFALLFDADPAALCAADESRYLEVSREVTGEVMARTLGEWRRARSTTRGALLWFLRDLWAGPGWGVVAADGQPKAAWHHVRRASAPIALHCSDEGGNGLALHVANDTAAALDAQLEIAMWRADGVNVGRGARALRVDARASVEVNAVALLDGFHDLNYAYRFGPPPHDLVSARLLAADQSVIATAYHVIGRMPVTRDDALALTARAFRATDQTWRLSVGATRFAQYVRCAVDGYRCSDDHFHLAPGEERTLRLTPLDPGATPAVVRGEVRALNSSTASTIMVA